MQRETNPTLQHVKERIMSVCLVLTINIYQENVNMMNLILLIYVTWKTGYLHPEPGDIFWVAEN